MMLSLPLKNLGQNQNRNTKQNSLLNEDFLTHSPKPSEKLVKLLLIK